MTTTQLRSIVTYVHGGLSCTARRCALLISIALCAAVIWQYDGRLYGLTFAPTLKSVPTTSTDWKTIPQLGCRGCQPSISHLENGISLDNYLRQFYLELVKFSVTGYALRTEAHSMKKAGTEANDLLEFRENFNDTKRCMGGDWPQFGYAMTGLRRTDRVQEFLIDILESNIPGDFMECGVWRGGTSIVARATLLANGGADRIVYVADSFRGLPKARLNVGENLYEFGFLSIPLEAVHSHFKRFYVYDPKQVRFVVGFFNESMPVARRHIGPLALLRLDGDMYESCFDVLNNMLGLVYEP